MFEDSKFQKNIFTKRKHTKCEFTGENLPKELLDEISTGNVEKIVRILLTDKNIARYIIKYKPNGNRSERKKGDWYAVVTINLDTNKQKKSSSKHAN